MAFQYPIEIPGVNITPFLKASLNAKLKKELKPEVDALSFAKELKAYVKDVRVLMLKDDLKYYNEEDIDNLHNLTPKEILTWN